MDSIIPNPLQLEALKKAFPSEPYKRELESILKNFNARPQKWERKGIYLDTIKRPLTLINFSPALVEKSQEVEDRFRSSLLTAAQIEGYKPNPQPYLINGILPRGKLGFIVSKRGKFKTWISLNLGLAVASGTSLFGNFPTNKGRVLFVSEEDALDTIADRVKRLARDNCSLSDLQDNFSVLCQYNLKFNADSFKRFKSHLDEFKPDLIIFDCLQRFVSFDLDRENHLISELFTDFLIPLTLDYDCSILFVHHQRKGDFKNSSPDMLDEVRGGSELVNLARYVYGVSVPENQSIEEPTLIFSCLKMSGAPMFEPMAVSFASDEESGAVNLVYKGKPEEALSAAQLCANAIKEFCTNQNRITYTRAELQKAVEPRYKRTVLGDALKLLITEGIMSREKKGVYTLSGNLMAYVPVQKIKNSGVEEI